MRGSLAILSDTGEINKVRPKVAAAPLPNTNHFPTHPRLVQRTFATPPTSCPSLLRHCLLPSIANIFSTIALDTKDVLYHHSHHHNHNH